jgi:hypothetical protein
MPALAVSPLVVRAVALGMVVAAMALGAALGYRAWKRARVTPEERERRRRGALVAYGKLTDATLVEIREDALFYSYLVRGVEYVASQDVAALKAHMPDSLGLGVSSVSVKYDARNPANSIVLAEEWSGLHGIK